MIIRTLNIVAISISFDTDVVVAQNLVPNGSFEEYFECPSTFGSWPNVVGWFSPYTQSADYFNSCAGGDVCSVPFNQCGYQQAAHGQAYIGLGTYSEGNPIYREFMATELPQELDVDVPLCLSFKMAVGGFGSLGIVNSAIYTAKGIGMKFFTELPETSNPPLFSDWATYLYPNSAALHLDVIPTDTAIWYSVSGIYIPDSAYRYLVIGNFFEDSLSDPILIDTIGFGNLNAAYAFIDDVRASSDLTFCDPSAGVGIRELLLPKVYPNPFSSELFVEVPTGSNGPWSVHLFNSIGALVMSQLYQNGPVIRLLTGNLPVGVYQLHIMGLTGASHSSVLVQKN